MIESLLGVVSIVFNIIKIASLAVSTILIGGYVVKRIKCNKYFEYDRDVDWYPMNVELDFEWDYEQIELIEAGPTLNVKMSRSAYVSCYSKYADQMFSKSVSRELYRWNADNIGREFFNSDNQDSAIVAHIPYTGELYSYDKRSGNVYYMSRFGGGGGGGGYCGDLLANTLYQADARYAYNCAINWDTPEGYNNPDKSNFKKANQAPKTHKEYHCCVPVMICSKEYADSFDPGDRTEFIMYIVDDNGFNNCISFYVDPEGNRHMEKMPSCLFKKILFDGLTRMITFEGDKFITMTKAKRDNTYRFMKFFSCRKSKY